MSRPAPAARCAVAPFALKDAPALIEHLLPVQKLSVESYKEQMAGRGKTLTALGSYWKGRKPLILAKACVLGCLLPATDNPQRDLEVFEMLMSMDELSFGGPRPTQTQTQRRLLPRCLSHASKTTSKLHLRERYRSRRPWTGRIPPTKR